MDTNQRVKKLDEDLRSTRDDLKRAQQDLASITRDEGDLAGGGVPTNHMADYGSQDFERERLMTIEIELSERIQLIEEAQARVADGTYGTCLRCGQEIDPERLDALPFAAYCIKCQEIVDGELDVTGVKPYQPLTP